jgi:predicted O-methyltransferase YrrM
MTDTSAPITPQEVASWYQNGTFTEDWTSWHFTVWVKLLGSLRFGQISALEIGSWEGRSALFFLNYLPGCRLVCIDTFTGGEEHQNDPKWVAALAGLEQRFDNNLAAFKSRVEKIKATSHLALAALGVSRRRFDLAYIDGSHLATDVYSDAMLTWPILNRKAILIFDDYEWVDAPEEHKRPKPGIDAFLWHVINEYVILYRGYQLILQKM